MLRFYMNRIIFVNSAPHRRGMEGTLEAARDLATLWNEDKREW
jgi:hypothetical protein